MVKEEGRERREEEKEKRRGKITERCRWMMMNQAEVKASSPGPGDSVPTQEQSSGHGSVFYYSILVRWSILWL